MTHGLGSSKVYLGDGVYVVVEAGMLKLTTEDGNHTTNTIYLEWFVYEALTQYVQRLVGVDPPGEVPRG